jgi:hypothetical protein
VGELAAFAAAPAHFESPRAGGHSMSTVLQPCRSRVEAE